MNVTQVYGKKKAISLIRLQRLFEIKETFAQHKQKVVEEKHLDMTNELSGWHGIYSLVGGPFFADPL